MQQANTVLPISTASSLLRRAIRLVFSSRISTDGSNRVSGSIEWTDSDPGCEPPDCPRHERPISGGYNEAYIVQFWTSYHLK